MLIVAAGAVVCKYKIHKMSYNRREDLLFFSVTEESTVLATVT